MNIAIQTERGHVHVLMHIGEKTGEKRFAFVLERGLDVFTFETLSEDELKYFSEAITIAMDPAGPSRYVIGDKP